MRILTNTRMTGFSLQRLEREGLGAWVNVYLKDGNEVTDSLIELTSIAECDELIKAAVEAKRLLTPPEPSVEDMTILVLGDPADDPVSAALAEGFALSWDTGTVQNAYVLSLRAPDRTVTEVGYGQTQDEALGNLREHLAAPGTGADAPDRLAALLAAGHKVTYSEDTAVGGWWANLIRPDGTFAGNGLGETQEKALAQLRERVARQGAQA